MDIQISYSFVLLILSQLISKNEMSNICNIYYSNNDNRIFFFLLLIISIIHNLTKNIFVVLDQP